MNRFINERILNGPAAMIALSVAGMVAGCLLGSGVAHLQARDWLDHYAKLAVSQDNAALEEGRKALDVLKDSGYSFCSDPDVSHLRDVVFSSEHLKDSGRIRGGKIECSATGGRAERIAVPVPDYHLSDGTLAYNSLVPAQDALKRPALQLGSAYVVLDTNLPPSPGPIPMHLSVAMANGTNSQAAAPAGGPLQLTTDGIGSFGNTLYATRCSDLGFNCVTAYTSSSEAFGGEVDTIVESIFGGVLAGVLLAMALPFIFTPPGRDMGQQLRRAVQRGELKVFYQPIVNLETKQVVGAEALARWTDELGNEVSPDVFIKLAEEQGFVGLITKSVLERALSDLGDILRTRPAFRLSINITARDLVDPNFLTMLVSSLEQTNVKPASVVLEITERSASDSDEAMETIRNLRRLGHSIHIDDFGTGYSNLDKLLCLFADTVKIDKAFTKVIGTESVAAAILPQIMAMAKSLGLEVVVEGVETNYQADYFSPGEQKIYAQGWLYGRPTSIEEFLGFLADNRAIVRDPAKIGGFDTKPGALRVVSSRVVA